MYDILPESIKEHFAALPIGKVYELRLRSGCPCVVSISGRSFFLTRGGVTQAVSDAIVVSKTELETVLHKAADYSLYAVNDQLRQAFITIRGGIRIGVCGEVVLENGKVTTIKNVQSLNIRVPHQIRGCSYQILPYVFSTNNALNTLIISPPGCGKTTMLRDIAWQLSDKYQMPNVLVVDERGEIAATYMGENQLDVGAFSDVMTGCSKTYGFENGIRSMKPDVIIVDELGGTNDVEMVKQAVKSGVCVFASVHAKSVDDLRSRPVFRDLVADGVFDRYVVLTSRDTAGHVVCVYDRFLKPVVV